MRTHLLTVAWLAAVGILSGCAGKTQDVAAVGMDARRAVSHAALAQYPGGAVDSPDLQLTAINYPGKRYLEIHNPTSQSLGRSTVWVNGTFVTMVDGIPPRGFVTIRHAALLEAGLGTNDLTTLKQQVAKVEVETGDGLFAVQGPTVNR